jgi:ParB-like chromosome segregation protein Spo0J
MPREKVKIEMPIHLDMIVIPDGRRPVDPSAVRMLAQSISEIGLQTPICIHDSGDGYVLIAGRHRLEAFRKLGKEHIPAVISKLTKLEAELWEIDENLCRSDLTPAQEAIAIARRKEIYEALHPETRRGVAGAEAKHGRATDNLSFAESTADARGKSKRTVERAAKRGEDIAPESLEKVVGTSLDKGDELDALTRLSDENREALIERAGAGEKVSAKAEIKKEARAERERELAKKQRALPQVKCGLIYLDVPRHFRVHSDETGIDRSPENHYPTMTFDEIAAFPIDKVAADDCVCLYWSTAASLVDDLEILAEWGFASLRPRDPSGKLVRDPETLMLHRDGSGRYASMQVWDKVRIGLGYWFRDRHEFMLVGVRGNPVDAR